MAREFTNLETNVQESSFSFADSLTDNTYESSAIDDIPDVLSISNYSKHNYVFDKFGFLNPGLGESFQQANGYSQGVGGLERMGGGAYYFLELFPNVEPVPPIVVSTQTDCIEPPVQGRVFWDWISTFWSFLSTRDRETWEAFWKGLTIAGVDMNKKASRFERVIAPEDADTCVLEDYYDLQIGPLYSVPTDLDPTLSSPNYIMRPLRTILRTPTYDVNNDPIYCDYIEITARDYYSIREIGLDQYVVVQSKNDDIDDQYFPVKNLLSSEERRNRPASMIVDGTRSNISDLFAGAIQFTADDYLEDVSQYDIFIVYSTTNPNSVTWTATSFQAVVDLTAPTPWNVGDLVAAANAADPNKWATLSDLSPKGQEVVPFLNLDTSVTFPTDAIKFEDFASYISRDDDQGRYFPIGGMTWQWRPGFGPSDGDVGDLTLGRYIENSSEYRYIIEVDGSLSYLGVDAFNTYFTSGLVYDINTYVEDLPILQDGIETSISTIYKKDIDYRFYNNTVEFFEDIFLKNEVQNGDYLWNPKTPVIENYLYDRYGSESNVINWQEFNYNNISGRTGVSGALKSLQNSSNTVDYERAMNIYYGLPIAPDECDVIGTYESYQYTITAISGNDITLQIPDSRTLHNFIQINTRMLPEDKTEVIVDAIINRNTGEVTVNDASELSVGDKLYTRLTNKYVLKGLQAEDKANEIPAYVDIYSPEGAGAIQHLIDIIQVKTDGEQFPELLIYGTDKLDVNYNGVYHVTSAEEIGGVTRLHLYLPKETDEDSLYNDYIGVTTENIEGGFAHISWPTHKFSYLFLRNEQRYFKAYLDAPIDTIYDTGDVLGKYDVIARNIAVLDDTKFPGWEEFDKFRRQNGINLQSDYVELTNIIPGAEFGKYFPSEYVDSILP
jgi:hypothetical protein